MKRLLAAGLVVSLIGNLYLAFQLMKAGDAIEGGVHAERMSSFALEDLSYLLRNSGLTQAELVALARKKPAKQGEEREPHHVTANRLVWFPVEVTFTGVGTIDQIRVAGDAY